MKEYYCCTPAGEIIKRKIDFTKSECLFDFLIGNVCDDKEQCFRYKKLIMERIQEQIENCQESLTMIEESEPPNL